MVMLEITPVHIQLDDYLNRKGIKKAWVANQLNISPQFFNLFLRGHKKFTDEWLNKINLLLETNFQPTPDQPLLLPHEQFESDKQKAKSLFKEP